jgi:hypothetical protein
VAATLYAGDGSMITGVADRVLEAIRKALASAAGRPPLDIRTVPAS